MFYWNFSSPTIAGRSILAKSRIRRFVDRAQTLRQDMDKILAGRCAPMPEQDELHVGQTQRTLQRRVASQEGLSHKKI
jgi:hypothetical protein